MESWQAQKFDHFVYATFTKTRIGMNDEPLAS